MMATGVQVYFEQEIAFGSANQAIIEHGFFRAGHLALMGVCFVLLFVSREPMGEQGLIGGRTGTNHGVIGFLYLTIAKHFVQSGQCLASAGKHHYSTYRAV